MQIKKKQSLKKISYKIIKTIFDLFFALIILIVGAPIFIVIAVLVKLSSRGPIFFLQERIGKNKKTFNCIKFRTMHPEAEDILEDLMINNQAVKKEF